MTESDTATAGKDPRIEPLHAWLASIPEPFRCDPDSLTAASSDASFRRYFRVSGSNAQSFIIMDAPPAQENCGPFIRIAKLFAQAGLLTPIVHAADPEQGFLLLSDLGNQTLLRELQAKPTDASVWYRQAAQALVGLQQATQAGTLPPYDGAVLRRELELFDQWYLVRHKGVTLSDADRQTLSDAYDAIVANNLAQSTVFVHRDFHSRNLMVQPDGERLGVLDFQDALVGPITYDIVSLLRDAYIEWPEELVIDWAVRYWESARKAQLPVPADFGDFWRDFEFMGLQRHLKILGIFARLNYRDGKSNYLDDMPVVLNYALKAMRRYAPLGRLTQLLERAENVPMQTGTSF